MRVLITFAGIILLMSSAVRPCTAFVLNKNGQVVFGRTYDWHFSSGLLLVNPRGLQKSTMPEPGVTNFDWTSRYGSVTFNQYGREFPSGGMNETGLVIEVLWLNEAQWPAPDDRPAIGCLQWVQYQLDNYSTVQQVLDNIEKIRIVSLAKVHYFLADAGGASASIEFVNGRAVVHSGDNQPFRVLTNDTYQNSLRYLDKFDGFGGSKKISTSSKSLPRFARACNLLSESQLAQAKSAEAYAMKVIGSVKQKSSQWQIVYNISAKKLSFRTRKRKKIKTLDLNNLDFSCARPLKMLALNSKVSGNINDKLKIYAVEANQKQIKKSFKLTKFLKVISRDQQKAVGLFPETFTCTQ